MSETGVLLNMMPQNVNLSTSIQIHSQVLLNMNALRVE